MNMIRVGSTMTTEAWDEYYKPNLTWNHAWGSAPANILPRRLIGIEPLEQGFRTVRIRPRPGSLRRVELRTPTISGGIMVSWKRDDSRYHLDLTVPANTSAEVWLPARIPESLMEGEVRLSSADGVRKIDQREGVVICRIGGGDYRFSGVW